MSLQQNLNLSLHDLRVHDLRNRRKSYHGE
jgi:hypothetical protein